MDAVFRFKRKRMKRLNPTMTNLLRQWILLTLGLGLLGGCQMLHPDYGALPSSLEEEQRNQTLEEEGFMAQSDRLLKPKMPDGGANPRQSISQATSQRPASAASASPMPFDTHATPFQQSLYLPQTRSSVFHRVMFDTQTVSAENAVEMEITADETVLGQAKPTENREFLQPKPNDSEALCRLLELVRKTGPDDWNADLEQLRGRLELYRSTITPGTSVEDENYALMMLSQWFFRDYKTVKRRLAAPAPGGDDEEILAERSSSRSKRTSDPTKPTRRTDDWYEDEGDVDMERQARYERADIEKRSRRPFRPLPDTDDDEYDSGRRSQARSDMRDRVRTTSEIAEFHGDVMGEPRRQAEEYAHLPQLNPSPIIAAGHVQTAGRGSVMTAQYVQPVSYQAGVMTGGDWMQQARSAADALRRQMEADPAMRTFGNEGRLRLLELALGNRGEAVRPFTTLDPSLNSKSFQEFWSNNILGFSTLLDETSHPNAPSRLLSVSYRLGEGGRALANLCPIQLKNVRLVRKVEEFAKPLPRNSEDCHAGEMLLVYVELENPTVRLLAEGHGISVSFSYEVRNETGEIVHKASGSPIQEVSLSRKRDYFGTIFVELPRTLVNGNYHLRVCVNDMFSDSLQYAEEQLPIRVVPSSAPLN